MVEEHVGLQLLQNQFYLLLDFKLLLVDEVDDPTELHVIMGLYFTKHVVNKNASALLLVQLVVPQNKSLNHAFCIAVQAIIVLIFSPLHLKTIVEINQAILVLSSLASGAVHQNGISELNIWMQYAH